MPSALQRAREQAMKGMGDGEWLENDALIGRQAPFVITDVRDDRGGGFQGADRWVLRVEPFDENEEFPDGLVSLTDNPARRKFMGVLDQELDSKLKQGQDPVIGPCVMVRLKGKNYRYNEIVDWDENENRPILPPGAVMAGARVEEDMRPPRRPRAAQSEPAPPEVQRPFAGAVAESKAEAAPAAPSRRQAKAAPAPEPVAPPENGEVPSLVEYARDKYGYKRGRVANDIKAEYEAKYGEGEQRLDPKPAAYQGSVDDVDDELAQRAVAMAAARSAPLEPADVPVSAPNRRAIPGYDDGQQAQEIRFRPGMTGTSLNACPSCGKKIHDRIFPTNEGSGYALVHARCEAGGDQQMMEATPDSE